MTPELGASGADDLPSALLEAARGIEVVDTGATEACLLDMRLEPAQGTRTHRVCLRRDAATTAPALVTACGRIATRHIVLSRYAEDRQVTHTRMTLQSACPPGPQFGCDGLEGSGLTLFGYTQPADELAQARAGCEQLGGRWQAS